MGSSKDPHASASYHQSGKVSSTPESQNVQSRALDDLIMGTNSSSIVSKRSVERIYYPDEPHFFRYFVSKYQRRAPLINRGYWLRLRLIDRIVHQFLARKSPRKKVVINLGCGSDVLPWQCHARYPDDCEKVLFVDIDYPDLMRKKRAIIVQTPQLNWLLGSDPETSDDDANHVLLRSERYCQLACDLRDLKSLRASLQSLLELSKSDVLFVAEVSITYMDTASADALIQWASSIGQAEFCLLEQILPHGAQHPFAQTMLGHFDKLKTPPRSVHKYPSLASQRTRFTSRGWQHVVSTDLWDAWTGDQFVTSTERRKLDEVEPFDEWEEFVLFARHYVVLHAQANPGQRDTASVAPLAQLRPQTNLKMNTLTVTKPQWRRFGSLASVPHPEGGMIALHMMGSGVSGGRSDIMDAFAPRKCDAWLKLPLDGPSPRTCASTVDVGSFGSLLIGGRASPSAPMSDCWLLRSGLTLQWEPTFPLPVPLYRHMAVRLKGWRTCQVLGSQPPPVFGGLLCTSDCQVGNLGKFWGLTAGGITTDGLINSLVYSWTVKVNDDKPVTIAFSQMHVTPEEQTLLSVFGAQTVEHESNTLICGGVGSHADILGRNITNITWDGTTCQVEACALTIGSAPTSTNEIPLMIGSSCILLGKRACILGGGATCFSMGTFWESRICEIDVDTLMDKSGAGREGAGGPSLTYSHSLRMTLRLKLGRSRTQGSEAVNTTKIPRLDSGSHCDFAQILRMRKPVILENLDLGVCVKSWTAEKLVERIGGEREVIIHDCENVSGNMDFQSKNFQYSTIPFGSFMARATSGAAVYLRSLSASGPSDRPASLEADFPTLSGDFVLPPSLDKVRDALFSSILRISGRATMWLHYDVMANIYAQIRGSRRMILFPPGDVRHLHFAAGASSSSLDVFAALEVGSLHEGHPHEARLLPGDVLFLPPMWMHTAVSLSDLSIAVNVFFRDLASGYSLGRDVYGNRDLSGYEKSRQDVVRMGKNMQDMPPELRHFYLSRIADEVLDLAEAP